MIKNKFLIFSNTLIRGNFLIKIFSYIVLILPILTHTLPEKEQCQSSLAHLIAKQKLDTSIDSLPLSSRTKNTLRYNNILTLRDLIQRREKTLLFIHQIGQQTLAEIKRLLDQLGLRFREENESIISQPAFKQLTQEQQLNTSLHSLPFFIKVRNILQNNNILTLGDLIQKTEKDLLFIPNLGRKTLDEIKNFLDQIGLSLQAEHTISTFNQLSRDQQLNTPIRSLSVSTRTRHILQYNDILTLGNLIQKTEQDLLLIPHLGRKTLDEIKNFLAEMGFSLREENENSLHR